MKIQEIRETYKYFYKPDCHSAAAQFMRTLANDYQVAITLTLKEKWYHKNGLQKIHFRSDRIDIPHMSYIFNRFEHKLNKLVWKQKYYRHHAKRLQFFKVWENGKGSKRLHFHGAIGNFPPGFQFSRLPRLVDQAARECCEIDIHHREDLCDADWFGYITKEVGKSNTDNILW